MRKLFCFITVLFGVLNAFGQTTDTVRKDTSKAFIASTTGVNKPVYVVDGAIFHGDLNGLNPDNISSITVLKSPSNLVKYGPGAVNGVIMIDMKDGSAGQILRKQPDMTAGLSDSAMYVVDGVVSDKKLEGIKPEDILAVRVTRTDNNSQMPDVGKGGIIAIETKSGAARKYQHELSGASADYKKYIDSHNGDDSGISYILDGTPCDKGQDGITRLYSLSKEKISKIKISSKGEGITVAITTKK